MVKVVINDVKNGKSFQKELDLELFTGKKIGEKFNGDLIGLKDYELEITGGSDNAGFPLSSSFESPTRKKILISRKGGRKIKRNVRGNQFGPYMAQINMKVTKPGSGSLAKALGLEEKPKEETKPAEQAEKKIEEKDKK